MQTTLKELLKENVFKYFYEISQIPRESGNEKAVSDYIYNMMIAKGLQCHQDNLSSLIIKKPAQGTSINSKPIILQAHLDMVCVKTDNSTHNFETDPIAWKIDGDWISSDNGTSLGADCGIGVALIMAILMADDISHPPIEAVFTTREETDMLGAYGIDTNLLSAKRMINFDISPDNRLLAGSCGGVAIEAIMPLQLVEVDKNSRKSFSISIDGMKGGHSGANINSGHGNAIVLLARVLKSLSTAMEYDLVSFEGGNSRLAIPTLSNAVITVMNGEEGKLAVSIEAIINQFHDELLSYSSNAKITLTESLRVYDKIIDKAYIDKIINACLLFPTGIQEMNFEPKNTVESSCNLGIAKMTEDGIIFVSEARTAHESTRRLIVEKYLILSEILGAKIKTHSEYSSWKYSKNSQLRDTITSTYKHLFSCDMDIVVAHSGNEIGIFYDKIESLDAVAMGPTREKYHTPKEVLSISSVKSFYQLLINALSNL